MSDESDAKPVKSRSRTKTAANQPAGDELPPFEIRLARLEEISESIRRGDVGLEDATKLFEEGVQLARGLEEDLSRVERRIEILVNEPNAAGEKPVLELFPELREL